MQPLAKVVLSFCLANEIEKKFAPKAYLIALAAGFVGSMAVVFVLSNVSADFVREYINSLIF